MIFLPFSSEKGFEVNQPSSPQQQLIRFDPNNFNIIYTSKLDVNMHDFDTSKIYIVAKDGIPPANVSDVYHRGNSSPVHPIINILTEGVIGYVYGNNAVLTVKAFKQDDIVVIDDGQVSIPRKFGTFPHHAKVTYDCGIPVRDGIYIKNIPADHIVKCGGRVQQVTVAGITIMSKRYYLYKYARKTTDDILYNYIQRMVQAASKNDDLELAKRLVEDDQRIQYLRIDPDNKKVHIKAKITVNVIRAYDNDNNMYTIKLDKPLEFNADIRSSFYDLSSPRITVDADIHHSNIMPNHTICTGNITIDTTSLLGMVTTVKSILEVLQYPNLDNGEYGYEFLKFLINNGYIAANKIPEPVLNRYGISNN